MLKPWLHSVAGVADRKKKKWKVVENEIGMRFVAIPGGAFMMGSMEPTDEIQSFLDGSQPVPPVLQSEQSEFPRHEVRIKDFLIGQHPVTLGQFKKFIKATGSSHLVTRTFRLYNCFSDECPVVDVNWHDAQRFVGWLNDTKGPSEKGAYRLPSESEWEYMARAGTTSAYWFGDSIRSNVICFDARHQVPVGTTKPNMFGVIDALGNVREWVEDCWHPNYHGAPDNGSAWVDGNSDHRVLRGGGWGDFALFVRSAARFSARSDARSYDMGFRVAKTIHPSCES